MKGYAVIIISGGYNNKPDSQFRPVLDKATNSVEKSPHIHPAQKLV
jgi:hypothetical protein